jgi:S1-C subfamily serine protease
MDTEHGQSAPFDAAPPPSAGGPADTPAPAATPEQPPAAATPAPPPPPPAHWPGWQGTDWPAGQAYGPGGQGYGPAGAGYGPATQGYGPGGQGYGQPAYGPAGQGYGPGGQGYGQPAYGTAGQGYGQPGYGPAGQGYGPAGAGYGPAGQGYAPGGPGYPPGYGAGGPVYAGGTGEAGRPGRRRRGMILAAAGTALALAAGGTAWVATAASDSPLSTNEIASRTDAGLVDITSTLGYQQGTAEGTGMVLTSNGQVLTNNHVIDGATAIKVRDIGNGRTYTAKVVGYNETSDVAVLQLQGASGLSTVSISSTTGLRVGQPIVALGNALGKGGTPAVATGHITGLGATITAEDQGSGSVEQLSDMIRTNAGIQPGDSGGPLVNSSGQVVGMDTAASTNDSGQPGTTAAVTTTAFAIPISRAISIADQIEAGTASSTMHLGATAFLGVAVSSESDQGGFGQASTGATIEGVVPGGPASQAGLAAGDTIESIGGHQIAAASDLHAVIEGYHPGDKVTVTWIDQSGQSHSAEMTLATGPAA